MTRSRSTSRRWWAPATIGVIAAAMIAVVLFSNNEPGDSSPTSTQTPAAAETEPAEEASDDGVRVDVERRDPDDPLAVGALDAPVGLVMFSDFQCGFCALWSVQTLPEMLEFVEAGELRIEWRDISLFGEASNRAALAAYAAGEQGEYLAFSRALFASGSAPDATALSDDGLETLAADLDLDVDKFNDDRTGEAAAAGVQANIDEAAQLGAASTPAFLVNGRPIMGAQPTEVFVSAISEELRLNS